MRSVSLATPGANVGRLCARAQPFLKPLATTGSAVLGTAGMDGIGRSYARVLQPFVGIWQLPSFLKNARGSRLDGQYGTGAVLSDVAGFAFVTRGKDYTIFEERSTTATCSKIELSFTSCFVRTYLAI